MSKELDRAARYRAQAIEALQLAERHWDTEQRAVLLDLAATYHRLAEQIEEIYRLDIEPHE